MKYHIAGRKYPFCSLTWDEVEQDGEQEGAHDLQDREHGRVLADGVVERMAHIVDCEGGQLQGEAEGEGEGGFLHFCQSILHSQSAQRLHN